MLKRTWKIVGVLSMGAVVGVAAGATHFVLAAGSNHREHHGREFLGLTGEELR